MPLLTFLAWLSAIPSRNLRVNLAAKADAGEILVANVVRELAEGKEFMFG